MGRQHQEMGRPGVRQVPESSGEQRKVEKTGCEVISVVPQRPLWLRDRWLMMLTVLYNANTITTTNTGSNGQIIDRCPLTEKAEEDFRRFKPTQPAST